MIRSTAAFATVLAVASAVSGCGQQAGQVTAKECAPRDAGFGADVVVDDLAGAYRLTFVAAQGDSSGHRAVGRLSLHPQEGAARQMTMPGGQTDPNVTVPLYGATDIDLDAVNAVQMGDLGSLDPMRPGVMVMEQYRESQPGRVQQITIRLGSLANRRDIRVFDAGYTALQVAWIEQDGFGGTWASGVRGPQSGGYFCAVRVSDS